jgi:hypothetical protein
MYPLAASQAEGSPGTAEKAEAEGVVYNAKIERLSDWFSPATAPAI